MRNLIYFLGILSLGIIIPACGGKTETKENQAKPTSTAISPAGVPTNNTVNPPTNQNDGDADDVRTENTNSSVQSNINGQPRKDADDLRRSNINQRKFDQDDGKGNRPVNSRRDADDNGKRDNDGDSDDN